VPLSITLHTTFCLHLLSQISDPITQSAAIALKAHTENLTGIVGQVLNFPVTCHPKFFPSDKYEFGSYQQNHDASVVSTLRMEFFWDAYLPDPKPDVMHSPLLAKSLRGLPPACKSLPYAKRRQYQYVGLIIGANVFVSESGASCGTRSAAG
jgi:hypothetical protein